VETALVTIVSSSSEETSRAVAAFLSRYGSVTRANYASDVRAWIGWCSEHFLEPLAVARRHVELWARDMEERQGLAGSTIARRLSTIVGFYRFAVIDGLLERSPAEFVRRPARDTESTTLGLDRLELGAFIAQGGAAGPMDHALACLLGLLGLRVSEACGVDIENLGIERGHRTVFIIGKGNKPALIPLPPRVARAVDAARENRLEGPLLLSRAGLRLDRHAATRTVRRLARRAGITKRISPHSLRHSFITAALDAGVPLRDVQIAARHADPRTTTRYDRARNKLDRHASYIVAAFVAGAA
jgi:site-specific recombinase XerD